MKLNHVAGNDTKKVVLYALSTCVWCKKVKRLLRDLGVAYDYIDVDLLEEREKEKIKEEVKNWNPKCSFPTMVINEEKCIVGFDEQKIKMELQDT